VTRALRIGAPLAVLLAAGVAYASLPHTFAPGETLTSANLNADLANLDSRIAGLGGAHVYSVDLLIDGNDLATVVTQYPANWVTVISGTPTTTGACGTTGNQNELSNTLTLNFVTPFAANPICNVGGSVDASTSSVAFLSSQCGGGAPFHQAVTCVGP
jgi:hypothetical protein